jgi:hypothetical protein
VEKRDGLLGKNSFVDETGFPKFEFVCLAIIKVLWVVRKLSAWASL